MSVGVRFATTFAAAAVVVLVAVTSAMGAQSGQSVAAGQSQPAPPTSSAPVDLAHAKVTFQTLCSKCHDLGLITAQRHDRAGWNEIIQRMYGLNFVATEDEAREILEYLVANHPPRA